MKGRKQAKLSEADMALFEAGAERICKDFDVFCTYMIENQVKLSVKTGYIGKKDCFKINQLLSWKEDYEKEAYQQDRYAIIDYFLCFALRLNILEKGSDGKTGIRAVKGGIYESFNGLSLTARYLTFLAYLLSDYYMDEPGFKAIEDYEEMAALLEFCFVSESGTPVSLQQKNSFLQSNVYTYSNFLRIFQIMNICDTKFLPKPSPSQAHRTPLVESVTIQKMGNFAGRVMENCKFKDHKSFLELLYDGMLFDYYIKDFGNNFVKEEVQIMAGLLEPKETEPCQQVYKLEISLRGYNCKRTIRIDSSATLQRLHDYIQQLYDFDDDHMYCFTIGSGREKTEFFRPEAQEDYSADEVTLGELGLLKGQAFTYLFDFGDYWEFTIKVKDSQEGTLKQPETISAVGEPPSQYPNWDDEEWE